MDSGAEREDDAAWQTALSWVMALHESPQDARLREELAAWLNESPVHRSAYEEARRVWLLTGLVPPLDAELEDGDDSTSTSPPPSAVGRR